VTSARFDADYLNNPAPTYPQLSRRMREEGKVLLRVVVSADGTPRLVEISQGSGSERLDKAARSAVERWRFVPARQGERAIEAAVLVPIIFKLEGN
jgi:protein TonB